MVLLRASFLVFPAAKLTIATPVEGSSFFFWWTDISVSFNESNKSLPRAPSRASSRAPNWSFKWLFGIAAGTQEVRNLAWPGPSYIEPL